MRAGFLVSYTNPSMMKRFAILLWTLSLAVSSFAQTVEVADTTSAAPVQSAYALAEEAYARYFAQKEDPSSDKDQLYQTLMDCFTNYVKSMENADETQQADMKEKIRRLRPEFEMVGIELSNQGKNQIAYKFLECYLNIPNLPLFEGEQFPQNEQYPLYVFNVAAESHNSRDYESSVIYLKEYIELGEKRNQQICYEFLAADLERLKRYDEAMAVLDEGIMNYPQNLKMLKRSINLFNQFGEKDKAKNMFDRAIAIAPSDPELRRFKADIDYQNDRFADALPIYTEYYEQNPNDPNRVKKLALCHFNLAGSKINESNNVIDADRIKILRNEANEHLNKSIALLEPLSKNPEVVKSDPLVIQALSEALTQVGRSSDADMVRQQASRDMGLSTVSSKRTAPNFNEWFKPKLERILAEWERRGEFETTDEWQKRVSPETRKELAVQTRRTLEQDFIREYSDTYNLEDLTVRKYDPDHETFCVKTKQGDIYLKVPRAGNEAENFKNNWSGVRIQSPQFKVDKSGKLLLATAVFATPDGHYYMYDRNEPLEYQTIKIAKPVWNDDDLLAMYGGGEDTPKPVVKNDDREAINVGESTVDVNIPKTKEKNGNTYALIIANEKYTKEGVSQVPFAENDGKSFKKYCESVLGVPEENIYSYFNATYSDMIEAIENIKNLEQAVKDVKLLVYYSGHGQPDPSTKEAYLLPVDASARSMYISIKLSKFKQELLAHNPASVTLFLDACFSGANRDGQIMDKEARGVIIKPREETPSTKMVVFAACSGDETAYPYRNQKHGLFTYFLLKKLQEDKGKTTYKQLAKYIQENVKRESYQQHKKIQNPDIQCALPVTEWGNWRLDK